jgi:hypothetical protein
VSVGSRAAHHVRPSQIGTPRDWEPCWRCNSRARRGLSWRDRPASARPARKLIAGDFGLPSWEEFCAAREFRQRVKDSHALADRSGGFLTFPQFAYAYFQAAKQAQKQWKKQPKQRHVGPQICWRSPSIRSLSSYSCLPGLPETKPPSPRHGRCNAPRCHWQGHWHDQRVRP